MTARRSSATERRGLAVPPRRPTALLLAVAAVATLASGCASRNASTESRSATLLPGNQDTAARPLSDERAMPAVPKAGHALVAAAPATTPPATPPTPTSNPAWVLDTDAVAGMSTYLLGLPPQFKFTPEANPASPARVPLEIINMPMWLWVDTPSEQTTVTATNDVVVDWIVIDKVTWSIPGTSIPQLDCGNAGVANQGPGMPFTPPMDPANTAPARSEPCLMTFASPYYTTDAGGAPADGVYQLTGAVTWHVAWQITTPTGAVTNGTTSGGVPSSQPGAQVAFRVGEIQALATSP